jgi:hypothetical protein
LNFVSKAFLVVVLSIGCFACGFPSEEKVKNEFRDANPGSEPISAVVGEGDGTQAYYHIRYKKRADDRTYEQIWLYLDKGDGVFRISGKGTETIIK